MILPASNGKTFPIEHYRRMGERAAEYRRQERLILGKPVWAILRERRWAEALLFGNDR